jgi:4-hydroxybenzoate polyprenyltransferase
VNLRKDHYHTSYSWQLLWLSRMQKKLFLIGVCVFVCRFFYAHIMHTLHSNPANCWYLKATTFVVYQNQTLDQTINHIFDT